MTRDFIEAFDRMTIKAAVGKPLDDFFKLWINCHYEISNGYCRVITKEDECIATADFTTDHFDNKIVTGLYF